MIEDRWKRHVIDAMARRSRSALHAAIRLYGANAFTVEQIGSCETWEQLCEMEKAAIASYGTFRPTGYNLTLGGDGKSGCTPSDETRQKMSDALKGREVSEEQKAKVSAWHSALPDEVRADRAKKMSEANARRTPEDRARISEVISASKRGKKRDPETVAKIADALRGKPRSAEAIAKTTASNTGRKHSDEMRARMSEIAKARSPEAMANFLGNRKGVSHSEETRAKMSEAAQARREKTAEAMREIWRQRKAAQIGGAP